MIVHYSIVLEYESLYFKAIEGGVYITVAREQAIFDCPILKERQKLKYWGGGGLALLFGMHVQTSRGKVARSLSYAPLLPSLLTEAQGQKGTRQLHQHKTHV